MQQPYGGVSHTPEVKHLQQTTQIFNFIIMFFTRTNDDQLLWGSSVSEEQHLPSLDSFVPEHRHKLLSIL